MNADEIIEEIEGRWTPAAVMHLCRAATVDAVCEALNEYPRLVAENARLSEFVAYTLDEFAERMPSQWKAHARAALAGSGGDTTNG